MKELIYKSVNKVLPKKIRNTEAVSRCINAAEKSYSTEKCVCCGLDTGVPFGMNIGERKHYIVGCGQLCNKCYKTLYK